MKTVMLWALGTLGVLLLMGAMAFLIQGTDFFLYRTFAPRREAVRREVFEQSKAYRDGIMQELRRAQVDYARAGTPQQRQAIGSVVLHDAAGFGGDLPPDLDGFVREVRAGQIEGAQ